MAIVTLEYNSTISNLIRGQWQIDDYLIGAQLVSSGYTHSQTHITRSDIEAFAVGQVVQVSGKTATESNGVTTIDCADIDFTVNGTYSASWVILHEMDGLVAESTDRLMFAIKLNDEIALDVDVDSSIRIGVNGLARIVPADYEEPPVVDIPVDDGVLEITPGKTLDNPGAWVDGDVIGVTQAEIDAFALENLSFATRVTIWAPNGTRIIGTDANSVSSHIGRTCVYVNNCANIRFIGFDVDSVNSTVAGGFIINKSDGIHIEESTASFLKLWGIYYDTCNDIKVNNCEAHDVGQEGIICQMSENIAISKWRVTNNKVYNTGLNTPTTGQYFGEGIYLGSGTFPNYGPVRDVICTNNEVYNCLAEGIDCKSNVISGRITDNLIYDCVLPYNGAITVGSENETGPAGITSDDFVIVADNVIENITPVNGSEFTVFAHIVVGRGNTQVYGNDMRGTDFGRQYGLSIFKTCKNQDQNDIFVGPNKYGTIDPLNRISINVFNADLGAVDNPMDFFYTPNENLEPSMWYDFSQTNELNIISGKVDTVNDLSGGGYHMQQTDDTKRPTIDTRTINGVQAAEFDEGQWFLIENGPQLYGNSMIFAVVDSDDVNVSRWVLSLQDGSAERIGVGFNASGYWFSHNLTGAKVGIASSTGPVLIAGYRDGQTQYITDGTNADQNLLGLDARELTRWAIGAIIFNSSQSRQFDGAIGEIKVYDFYDADKFNSERTALAEKWGI